MFPFFVMLSSLAQSIAARRPPCARLLARRVAPRLPLLRMASASADGRLVLRALAPPLDAANHKGQAGRIGVVGGCLEYTGAPFFAGVAALRVGADLSHVFCTTDAATAIKSYSPELIVHPCLPGASGLDRSDKEMREATGTICGTFPRLSALVVGCGLGRDADVLNVAEAVVEGAIKRGLPLVLDGDGILLVLRRPQLLSAAGRLPSDGSPLRVILTPNVNEYRHLCEALGITVPGVLPAENGQALQHTSDPSSPFRRARRRRSAGVTGQHVARTGGAHPLPCPLFG
jgi:ATP-dependent NAD(P)H-hydrate dehydratase